ncbi:2-succinyl-6-hydroxy-2,4-cyclohexadiene-1-carboxylate synthase [Cytobacillus spongiae]|uniref:2-succinyl-6-hydroxy-2, 4-cyclohexadiene-1-carboxylate synthase n=1 Tax=Cytobacillus spongiae TaxID=2901381 RepID=UPI001F36E889|nr:2-succinyl-6-hydroxy-2,4-cyclohexadiene-1-carboxylate synthase [Cytobacillus spongiae]UII55313.1 2-succinyl-6-hydroxy-2,4-cyclohexadiene-1-carboxylate synthase [Cytobacillus spongiae]
MEFVLNEESYYVEMAGNGFPLFLLHGFTGDVTTWYSTSPYFASKAQLIFVDLLGHGKTAKPSNYERYDIQLIANDMVELLDKLGIEQVDILGYSMGGRLALTIAMLYPERVRKLILESASPGILFSNDRQERRRQDQQLAHFILEEGIERFVEKWENITLFQTQKNLPIDIQSQIRNQRRKNSELGLANSLLGMGTGSQSSWWNLLGECAVETLLITGELDLKFCTIAEKMQNMLAKCKWVNVNGCGHAIHVEEPEKFGTIVSEFLSK